MAEVLKLFLTPFTLYFPLRSSKGLEDSEMFSEQQSV